MADKNNIPVEIGAMPLAGPSADGQLIFFDFLGHDEVLYKFKVTHEAVGEIVDLLVRSAQAAEKARGGPDFVSGAQRSADVMQATSYDFGLSADGKQIILAFNAAGRKSVGFQLEPKMCMEFADNVRELCSTWIAPDQKNGKPN